MDATCESPDKSDENENQRTLCNSPRNNTNSSQSIKRESPLSTTTSLVDDVKKLEIRTSDPDLNRKFKTNSPLASSSNLSKPDPAVENLRLCSNNNENNSRKSELKWQCAVGVITCASLSESHHCFLAILDLHLRELPAEHKVLHVRPTKGSHQQSEDHFL